MGLKTRACTPPSGRRPGGGGGGGGGGWVKARLPCFLPDPERKRGESSPFYLSLSAGAVASPERMRGSPRREPEGGSAGGEARAAPGRERGGLAHAQGGGVPQGGKGAALSAPLWLWSDRTRRT